MASFIVVALASIWGFSKLPTSYIPEEDMGYFMTSIQLPTGASLERTEKVVNALVAEIKDDVPEVKDVMSVAGFSFMAGGSGSNLGSLFVMLKPWKERGTNGSIDKVLAKVNEIAARQQEAIIFSLNPPAIPGLGISSGLQLQLLDINNLGADEIMKAISELQMQGAKNDKFASITTMYQGEVPQYTLNLNRDKANLMGVDIENVYSALSDFLGGGYINNFIKFGRNFQVTMQAEGKSRQQINDILNISIPNSNGEMVPLSAILTPQLTMGVPSVNRYNMYTTAAITATPANGVSTSEAIAEMEQLVNTSLSNNFSYAWTGIAYQETKASTTISFVLIFAIIMTILVLAAQYESWTDPLAVILVMPIAILGIVIGSLIMHLSISIYSQIGLILLLGMSAKNAILIVEFASDFRKKGLPIIQAAHDAGVIRFRPIMMTALAFIFGVMPMMFSSGAGANSRIQLATAIVFGMAVNALIGTLLIPNFWLIMQQIQERYLSHLFPERR
jgi:hydrophobe/amphiphile efflux-1 (HAE1) family protein